MTVQHGELAWVASLLALAIYLVLVALGRVLKRRGGVQLGLAFQVFALAAAGFLALQIFGIDLAWMEFRLRRDVGALAVLFAVFFFVAVFDRAVWGYYFGQRRQTEIPKFLRDIFLIFVLTTVVLILLRALYQQPITGLLAGSGIAAIVLGLALQDLLGNVISGIALEMEKPFKAGDWLIVDGQHACVVEVNWRSTRLRTTDDICLDIPNAQIAKSSVVNFSYPTRVHAMHLSVGVHYDTTPNEVKDVLMRAAQNTSGVLTAPPPKIQIKEFGESAVIYDIKFWIEDHALYTDIADAIRCNVWYGLRRNKMAIPYPRRTVELERRRSENPQTAPASTQESLRRHALFQCLTDDEVQTLLQSAPLRLHGRQEKLVTQGAKGDSMFVLVAGTAEVFVQHEGNLTRVAALGPGDPFGEMSLLTGEQRSATVIAQTDCQVLKIEKPLFASVLQKNPDLLQKLSAVLAERRVQNEVAFANASASAQEAQAQKYRANFLSTLKSFFEL